MWNILRLTLTSLLAHVALGTGKLSKMFLKEEKICCKMVYYT